MITTVIANSKKQQMHKQSLKAAKAARMALDPNISEAQRREYELAAYFKRAPRQIGMEASWPDSE